MRTKFKMEAKFKMRAKLMKKRISHIISYILICLLLAVGFLGWGPTETISHRAVAYGERQEAREAVQNSYRPDNLIRFHVVANSDSERDQLLKYAVRDEILKEVSPKLARSASLAESREILKSMDDELLDIAKRVVREWGFDYPVSLEYGVFPFPAKSYGNIVLPGGNYEAVTIKIGRGHGANWWCILFPPICFVNVEEATDVPVDGKEAVKLDTAAEKLERKQQFCFFFERFFK